MSDAEAKAGTPGREILGLRGPVDRDYRVKLYDFRRPDKFSKEQLRTVANIHEVFARLAGTALSIRLRLPCEAHLSMVDQLTWEEYAHSMPTPTVLSVGRMAPLKGRFTLEIEPVAADAIVERLFGAGSIPAPADGTIDAPLDCEALKAAGSNTRLGAVGLTDLEFAALETVFADLYGRVAEAWSGIEKLECALEQVETDVQFAQIVPPHEMIVIATLELVIGGRKGLLNLVYPFQLIEPLVPKLSARYWYGIRGKPGETVGLSRAWRVPVPVEVIAAGARLSVAELRALRKGSLVALPGLDEGLARLRSGGSELRTLRLPAARSGRMLRFEVVADAGADEAPLEDTGGDSGRGATEGLQRSLEVFGAKVEASIASLGKALVALEGKQEALADRLLYGAAAGAEQDAGKPAGARPFSALAGASAEDLALFLSNERAQVAALVLSWLDPVLSSGVLSRLPENAQPEIARRVGRLDGAGAEVLSSTERVLVKKLAGMGAEKRDAGGVASVVGMLNLVPRAVEKHVVETLEKVDRALAEDVKRNMFVFEDISILEDESIDAVLGGAEERDLLVAMKAVQEPLRERLFARFAKVRGEAEAARLRAEFQAIGRVRLRDADEAGFRVVETVKALEEEGRIFIAREDD
ncbi:MAG TPA: FliG C-terminal domain-containing protein [Spirochaetales bacterium]|nr:FliG C-terminal domain-containing protein [Spirochaetales bacterium]